MLMPRGRHTIRHCPSLEPYSGTPLPKNDTKARSDLAIYLSQPNLYATAPRQTETGGLVLKSLPTGIQALVIHRRLLVDNCLLIPNVPNNFCLECTVIHDGGVEHERYTKQLFVLGCIAQFVQKSKQNIIISEMRTSSVSPLQQMTYGVPGPSIQQVYLSQHSLLSQQGMTQQVHDMFPPMRYGLGPYNGDI
jgi:hypothetical protein